MSKSNGTLKCNLLSRNDDNLVLFSNYLISDTSINHHIVIPEKQLIPSFVVFVCFHFYSMAHEYGDPLYTVPTFS